MKGILLAGGTGSRWYPLNRVAGKPLQPACAKPMPGQSHMNARPRQPDRLRIVPQP
jgi:dTDP-glucose pyrophosphorylase